MITWLLIGWPVVGAFGLVAWSCRRPADATTQAAEDAEQAAYLAEWAERRDAYRIAHKAKDTRKMAERWPALRDATNARLRGGV